MLSTSSLREMQIPLIVSADRLFLSLQQFIREETGS